MDSSKSSQFFKFLGSWYNQNVKKFLLFCGIVLLGLFFLPAVLYSMQNYKYKNEIDRVATESGIEPRSVDCRNVELAQICYADYSSMNTTKAKQMLTGSGYGLVDERYNLDGSISAINKTTGVRVDYDFDNRESEVMTLKFKDIEVTL